MAVSLGYTPPTPPDTGARDDADDLVRALHETGLLRALTGAVRAYPQLLRAVLGAVDPDTVRAGIELGGAWRGPDPERSAQLAEGVRRARAEAHAAANGSPEGPIALLHRLRDPDTRRGLSAALAALAALGGSLSATGSAHLHDRQRGDA